MSHQQNTFVPPTIKQRMEALGETDKVSINVSFKSKENYLSFFQRNEDIQRALTAAIDDSFPPIPIPNEGDWLNINREEGQTVKQFERRRKPRPRPSFVSLFFLQKKINHFLFLIQTQYNFYSTHWRLR